jgi:hypothetical protein
MVSIEELSKGEVKNRGTASLPLVRNGGNYSSIVFDEKGK